MHRIVLMNCFTLSENYLSLEITKISFLNMTDHKTNDKLKKIIRIKKLVLIQEYVNSLIIY